MIYPDKFEQFWSLWRETARPRDPKKLAFKAWSARLREGTEPELLLACAREYAHELRRLRNAGTEYVMMGSTFLGPNERWAEYQPKGGGASEPAGSIPTKNGRPVAFPEERIDARPFLREIIEKLANAKRSPTCNFVRGRRE